MSETLQGKMSVFGGPNDNGVGPNEGLALVNSESDFQKLKKYFLAAQPAGTSGYARRLDTKTFYIACRWKYSETPIHHLQNILVKVTNPANGKSEMAKPIDWGPNDSTGRIADLSNGLASALGLSTDDICIVEIALPGEATDENAPHVSDVSGDDLIKKVIKIAKGELGIREDGTSNRGARVDEYERADNLPGVGYAWCGSFLSWCLKQSGSHIKYCYSASCDVIAAWARSNEILHETPQRGDIFLRFAPGSTTDANHTGLVVDVDGTQFVTVEGNTNLDGSSSGIGVFSLTRHNNNNYRFVRWISLNEDQEAAPYTISISGKKLNAPVIGGATFVSVREWGEALGDDVQWNPIAQVPIIGGREFSVQVRKIDGRAYAPVRALAEFSNRAFTVDGANRAITVLSTPIA